MFLVYRPSSSDRGEPEEFHFDPAAFPNLDAEAIERETGLTWNEFQLAVQKGSTISRRALLWAFRRRTHRTLKISDVRFEVGEVDLVYDAEEMADLLAQARAVEPTTADMATQQTAAIAALERGLVDARPAPGKALASTSDDDTSSGS